MPNTTQKIYEHNTRMNINKTHETNNTHEATT